MTNEERDEATALENADVEKKVYFWARKYHATTGPDRIKCLKNMCVVIMQEKEKEKGNEKEKENTEQKKDE